jgi:hypothetical protein
MAIEISRGAEAAEKTKNNVIVDGRVSGGNKIEPTGITLTFAAS